MLNVTLLLTTNDFNKTCVHKVVSLNPRAGYLMANILQFFVVKILTKFEKI